MSDRPAVIDGKPYPRKGDHLSSRLYLSVWISRERLDYADKKFAEDTQARSDLLDAMKRGSWETWTDFAGNYIRRAELLGLNTPQGRQQLGKAIVTLKDTLETAIEWYGEMPKPGVPSGTIEDW